MSLLSTLQSKSRCSTIVAHLGFLVVIIAGGILLRDPLVAKGYSNWGNLALLKVLPDVHVPQEREVQRCVGVLESSSLAIPANRDLVRDAKAGLSSSLSYGPSDSTYRNLGLTYLIEGDYGASIDALLHSLDIGSGDVLAHFFLGCAYEQAGDRKRAVAAWKQVESFPVWHFYRGDDLLLAGDWDGALREYSLALEVEPTSILYHLVGEMHARMGHLDQAIEAYREAIRLNYYVNDRFDVESSHLELAESLAAQENWSAAMLELEALVLANPAYADAYTELGEVYYKGLGDFQQASRHLLRAIELNPDAAKAYLHLGDFNRREGHYEEAEKWLTAGLSLPRNMWTPWMHESLGRVYLAQGRYQEAAQQSEAVLSADPTNVWFLELTGDAYVRTGDLERARQVYGEAMRLAPENKRVRKKLRAIGDTVP